MIDSNHNGKGLVSDSKNKINSDPFHEMVSDVLNFSEMLHYKGYDVKEYKDGSIYKGALISMLGKSVRNGPGVMLYLSGRIYEGHWENDLREGVGFEKYA